MNKERDLVQAFDRLVKPLDNILYLLKDHAEGQRMLFRALIAIVILLLAAVLYQFQLASRLSDIERRVADVSRTSEEAKTRITETESKVDETGRKVDAWSKRPNLKEVLEIQSDASALPYAASVAPSASVAKNASIE